MCEADRKPTEGFLSNLSAPARRALNSIGIKTSNYLVQHNKNEILSFHGMGPASLSSLLSALKDAGLSFKADEF